MIEIWKEIKHYPKYKISNFGNIKSNIKTLKQHIEKAGYCRVTLYNNYKTRLVRVHRLVAEEFIPNPENKRTVNHKDTNKQNNQIDNLEWATYKENMKHACDNNLVANKERQGLSKLNIEDVNKIRTLYKNKLFSQRQLAKKYNVCQRTITMIVNNITWK